MNLNILLTHLLTPLHTSNFHKKLELKHTVNIVALSVFTSCVFSLAGAGAIPATIIGLGSFYSLTAALKTLGFAQYTKEDHEVDLAAYQERTIEGLFYNLDRTLLNKSGVLWAKNTNVEFDKKQAVLPEGWSLKTLEDYPPRPDSIFCYETFALLKDPESPKFVIQKSYKSFGFAEYDKDIKIWEVESSERDPVLSSITSE